MLELCGKQVAFDMDMRADYERFSKALIKVKKAQADGKFGYDEMEQFLTSCLTKKVVEEELLNDGRISTLVNVFMEFFNKSIEQVGEVTGKYKKAAEDFKAGAEKANAVLAEMESINAVTDGVKAPGPTEVK